jgi:drug/metabolite transporter (DMT)-like permease
MSMRLIFMTSLTMIAFAVNSILNRLAVDSEIIDSSSFAMVRVSSGALVLWVILNVKSSESLTFEKAQFLGALSLAAYIIGFSLAYATLDAGLGALILFGTVQISIFSWSALWGTRPSMLQICGAGLAFIGLLIALWPADNKISNMSGVWLMIIAGIGWACYTIIGKTAKDPLVTTTATFVIATPIVTVFFLNGEIFMTQFGVIAAIFSGAVTSGFGYMLWYSVLPQLKSVTASVVQLSVPIIAIVAGSLLLDEAVTGTIIISVFLVLGGILIAIISPKIKVDHR